MKEYNNVKIYEQNNEGNGICKVDNIVTFVPYTLKNDVINLEITKEKKNYYEGKCLKIIEESEERTKPLCPHYYNCGGCNIMHQLYNYQLEFKKNKVINVFKHVANTDINNIDIEYDDQFNYRNNIMLNVNGIQLGFFKDGTNEIVDISSCLISNSKINNVIKEIRTFINEFKDHNITRIDIKAYKNILVNIESEDFKYKNKFVKYVKLDSFYVNDEFEYGAEKITENFKNYEFDISAVSFFQKNTKVTEKLYSYVKSLIKENSNVLDLYCGIGTIGIYVADKCKNVIGIEVIKEAIEDAKLNAEINKINNIEFICKSVENMKNDYKNIDAIIVDPPRIGLDKRAINNILEINPNNIIYVSCNPVTLARDINLLKENYNINSIKLFDMFPNTYHVESVVLLERK